MDPTSNLFVLCTNVKVHFIIIHSRWSLALIFMKEMVAAKFLGKRTSQCKIYFD